MSRVILIAFLFVSCGVMAQSVSGIVKMEDKSAFEYVKVKVLNPKDSTTVAGIYTDVNGSFEVELEVGSYLLEASYTGFESYYEFFTIKSVTQKVRLAPFILIIDNTLELEGVVAKGSLDVLKAGIDKKIYNTSEDISTRGGSVQDVLNNIPSIQVDQDGNISLRGDANVIILIDGRPSALAMGDGQNLLDAMPANSVERIEVVTNPSAKYDPDGTSGIVNIVLKKNKRKGLNGIISGTAATGKLFEGTAAISYRNKSWNFYTNYSFNYYEGFRNFESQLDRTITADSSVLLRQQRDGQDLKEGHTLVLGTDYYFNSRSSLAFALTGSKGRRERTSYLDNFIYYNEVSDNQLSESWERNSFDPRSRMNFDANMNYKLSLKDDRGEWSINGNYSRGENFVQGFYDEHYILTNGNPVNQAALIQELENNELRQSTAIQTDFSYIFPEIKARMELGAKSIIGVEDLSTISFTQDTVTFENFEDTLSNFDYQFEQEVHSVYGIFGQELGSFLYQFGLRGEYAVQAPNLVSESQQFFKTYANLFPSGHLKYLVKDNQEFSLSYSRRINRPGSRSLNPFTSYADPLNLSRGNPNLDPEYINSFDLGYSITNKKLILTTSVFHRITKDVINRVTVYDDNYAISTRANVDQSVITGGELIIIYKPFPWLKNTISGSANYKEYTDSNPITDWNNKGFSWGVKYVGRIDFWKKTASFQINWNYRAPYVTPQGTFVRNPGITLSLDKRFFDKKLSVTLKATDIFNIMSSSGTQEIPGIYRDFEYKWLTRRVYVTLSYRFGKMDNKLKVPRSSEGGNS